MFTVFFHVYKIFSCLQDFFMFAVFFAYVNTICQTFHSNRLLCYSLLDKDSVLDNFTTLVTKQFSPKLSLLTQFGVKAIENS